MFQILLDADLRMQLGQIARPTGHGKRVLVIAAGACIATNARQLQNIGSGLAEADRSEFASPQEVNAFFVKHGCQTDEARRHRIASAPRREDEFAVTQRRGRDGLEALHLSRC